MKLRISGILCIILCWTLLIFSCSKDDPAPLKAQTNGVLLAGDAGKSKTWKLGQLSIQLGTNPVFTETLGGCFADNEYTFFNNTSQDYEGAEGISKCFTNDPTIAESGTWAFTLDGLILNVHVDNTQSLNGLFSPEFFFLTDSTYALAGYAPNPAFVSELTASKLVLEINRTILTTKIKYTMTFNAQ